MLVHLRFEVNEISWYKSSDLFFLTNGMGCINVHSYPDMKLLTGKPASKDQRDLSTQRYILVLQAHPGACICIEFDPTGRYFAVGSADALISLWDASELACVRTFPRLEWPVLKLFN